MIAFAPSVVSDRLQAFTRALDATPGQPGVLLVYAGERPAPGAAAAGSPLAAIPLGRPSLAEVMGSVATLAAPVQAMASASGFASWGRFTAGSGQWVADVDVGTAPPADVLMRKEDGTAALNTQVYAGGDFYLLVLQLEEV